MKVPSGMFRYGKLYRIATRYERSRNVWIWCIVIDRRRLIHKGRKP